MRIRMQLVKSRAKTYGEGNRRISITIHETANTSRGANAAAHANLQTKGNVRQASWHWTVDDVEAVQSFPHTVKCWHAGTRKSSDESIAIEICVNADGDYVQAVRNAAELVRRIRAQEPTATVVVQHASHSGKNCPTFLRDGSRGVTWSQFLAWTRDGSGATPVDKPKPSAPGAKRQPRALPPVLKRGSKGGWVGLWQSILRTQGELVKVDEDFGPATGAATERVQRKWGLVPDRHVGPRTWCRALISDASGSLAMGDNGPQVELWQNLLGITLDRNFGPDTHLKTQEVQRFLGVEDDGAHGRDTNAALRRHYGL